MVVGSVRSRQRTQAARTRPGRGARGPAALLRSPPLAVLLALPLLVATPAAASTATVGPAVASPGGWLVRRVAGTAAPWSVRLTAPEPLPGWSAGHGAALQDFFDRHADVFRLRPGTDRMLLTRETALPGTHHARMQQTCHGLPVLGADCTVTLGPDGDVRTVLGTFVPGVAAEVEPRLDGAAARTAALAGLPGAPADYGTTTRLAIRRGDGGDRLVYEVLATARRRPLSWRLLVDACDGTVLERADQTLRVTGSGCMVRFHPDTLSLEAVPFPRLSGDGTMLRGANLQVRNVDPVANPDAYSPTATFCYPPVEPDTNDFDQANVYWHIDHLLGDFLAACGYPGPSAPFFVLVQPDGPAGATAGVTTLADGVPCIWYGSVQQVLDDGTVVVRNGAQEASVVYHEAAHAVMLDIGILPGYEASVVHEGLADYFACAATGIPAQGTWTYASGTRVDTDPDVYNYDNEEILLGEIHRAGQILSGALWDMRTDPAMGTVTDQVVLRSLYYLPVHPDFAMVAAAVFNADCEIRGGADTAVINRCLTARGIPMGSLTPSVTIEGPSCVASLGASACGMWSARPAQGLRPYRYQWWRLYDGADGTYTWQAIGFDSVATACDDDEFIVQLLLTDARGSTAWANRSVSVAAPTTILLGGPAALGTSDGAAVCGTWCAMLPDGYRPYRCEWWQYACTDGVCAWTSIGSDSVVTACGAADFDLKFLLTDALGNLARGDLHVAVVDTTRPLAVAVGGPALLDAAGGAEACSAWCALPSGGHPPYRYEWRRYASATRIWTPIGSDAVVTACAAADFTLWLTLADARGYAVYAFRTVAVVDAAPVLALSLAGPAELGAHVPGAFTAVARGGGTPKTFRWVKNYTDRPSVPVDEVCASPGTDTCVVEVADDTPFTLEVSATDGTCTASAAMPVAIVRTPLLVRISGDASLPLGASGSYAAGAMGGWPPYRYLWQDQDCQGLVSSREQDAGDFEVGTVTADCDCGAVALRVTVTDGDGNAASDSLQVAVSCAGAPVSLAVTGGGAGAAAPVPVLLAVWTPDRATANLAIYDLGGRRLATLHQGDLPGGYHAFVWEAGGTPSGVYFARLATPAGAPCRRIVLVR